MAKVEGLKQLERNIQKLAKTKVPKAAAKAINQVSKRIGNTAMKKVAQDVGVPVKTIKGRLHRERAKATNPVARLKVNRLDMPAIRLFENRSTKLWEGNGGIVVGKYAMRRGFVQRLQNGRKHILQRQGKARYPIDVVKIPLAGKITTAFKKETENYPQEIQQALSKELSKVL